MGRFWPLVERLRAELDDIEGIALDILDRSTIRSIDNEYDGIVVITAAEREWAPSDPALAADRMAALGRWRPLLGRLEKLFPHPTPQVTSTLEEAGGLGTRWLERPEDYDYDIPPTTTEAQRLLSDRFRALRGLVDLAAGGGDGPLRLVPDTNAVIGNPDLASYSRAVATTTFDVHLVPTVLRELDQLKDRSPSPDVRQKAQDFIRRLKGLRDKGSLATGVTLTKTIAVRAEPREIDARAQLDWLDPTVPDDRILGCALELQLRYPSSAIVLITSDLNLQNKADAAGVPYAETPPDPRSLRAKLKPTLGYRPSKEAGQVPVVVLNNDGPRAARDIEYQVVADGRPRITVGPWQVDRLDVGASDTRDLVFGGGPAVVSARWTDDDGSHEQSWTQTFTT